MYQALIREFTGCNVADAEQIEELMRGEHRGVLSEVRRDQFRREARKFHKLLPELRTLEPDLFPTPPS